jgi:hypothetical protein
MASERFYELLTGLDAIVGKQSTRLTRYSVFDDKWQDRSFRSDRSSNQACDKVDFIGSMYVFLPDEKERQESVRQWVGAYIALEAKAGKDVMFIVSSGTCCGEQGCSGHYQEPLESAVETDLLLHDRFPKDLNGTYIYFIERSKFENYFKQKKK